MSHKFSIKQGDTAPAIVETLYNADGTVIDLTGALEVALHVFKLDRTVIVDGIGSVDDVDGVVTYQWVTGDTDEAGGFLREWQVTLSDGRIITVPNDRDGYDTIITRQGA